MHRAGTALRDPAAIFRAGQAKLLAQNPKQRCIFYELDINHTAIYIEFRHFCLHLPFRSA